MCEILPNTWIKIEKHKIYHANAIFIDAEKNVYTDVFVHKNAGNLLYIATCPDVSGTISSFTITPTHFMIIDTNLF